MPPPIDDLAVDWTRPGRRHCRRCARPLRPHEVGGFGNSWAWCETCSLVVDLLSRAIASGYVLAMPARTFTRTGVG